LPNRVGTGADVADAVSPVAVGDGGGVVGVEGVVVVEVKVNRPAGEPGSSALSAPSA